MRISGVSLGRAAVVLCLVAVNLWGQGSRQVSPYSEIEEKDRDHPRAREQWFARGRTVPGQSAAQLRYRAFQQKVQLRQRRALPMGTASSSSSVTPWLPLGPAPLASDAGTGQDYNWVSGRATAVAIDPADGTGNTVFIGGAQGGVWKSTNAGPASPSPGSVIWTPVADDAETLAVGAIAIQPGNNNPATSVVLVGTGEPNSSADSYYGLGILRSSNGGASWTLIPGSSDVPSRSFAGLGFSKIAFSTANPQLVVAAAAGASEGIQEGLENPITLNRGLYVSTNGGQTWKYASIKDGTTPTAPGSATSVVYNSSAGMFFAALRYHGVYSSADGMNWTRLADVNQPGGLLSAQCPGDQSSSGCPFYRAELSVVPGRNEMYVWVVSLDTLGNELDGGIWESVSAGAAPWFSVNDAGISSCGDTQGCGVIQGSYNLELLALPNGTATDLYAGAVNLYKCTIGNPTNPCSFLNLTHVYGTCASVEKVHPDQHHLAGVIASGKELLYFANDGGIYRALDGYTGLTSGSCGPNQFDSLNQTLGSMTQFVWFSIHPTDQATILGGTQDNGSPATSTATSSLEWVNVHAGDGGYNAILPTSPADWFASYPDVGGGTLEIDHCGSGINCNDPAFASVVRSSTMGGTVGVGGDDGGFYFPFILDPQSPTTMLIGTCRIWRVQNVPNPTSSTALSNDFEPGATVPCSGAEVNVVRSIAAGGPKDIAGLSKVIYAGTDGFGPLISSNPSGGRVFVTTSAGSAVPAEVTGSVNPNHYPVAAIAIDMSDASGQTAYVGIMGFHVGHVFKTTNAGGSWSNFTGSLPDAPVNSLLVDAAAGMIYAGTDVGVFASPTSGANWSEVGPAAASGNAGFLPNVPVTALQLFNSGGQKLLRASTYGRGVWQYNLVTTPDYAISVQNSPLTVFGSQIGAFSGTLTAFAGYSSGVALSCAADSKTGGTNPPTTCTPPANSVTPSTGGTPFQISVAGATGDYGAFRDYRFNVHGVGSDPSQVMHDATVTLHIVYSELQKLSPESVSVPQNSISTDVTVVVKAFGSFSGTVSLSCANALPTDPQCNFSSSSVQPTAANPASVTLTISTGMSTPLGPSTVTISATTPGAPTAQTQTLSVTVTPPTPDYGLTIANPTQSASVDQAAAFQGTLTSSFGYSSPVNLSCGAGAPPTCTISPASVTPTPAGTSFTVTVQSRSVQTYAFAIQGVGTDAARVAHSANLTFTSQFSFAVANASGPQTVRAGQTATYTLTVTPPAGAVFPSTVTFLCSGLPAGASCSSPQIAAGASGVQNVTLAITTLGLNSGTEQRPTAKSHRAAPFMAWISLAGLVFSSLSRRRCKRSWTTLSMIFAMATALILTSCGGTSSGSSGGGVTISVSPTSLVLFPTQQRQFTATVAGSSNTGVNWTASTGTIDANGLYTAPASVTASTQGTVTAVALADVTKSAQATVTIQAPTPSGSYTITITAMMGSIKPTTSVTLAVE